MNRLACVREFITLGVCVSLLIGCSSGGGSGGGSDSSSAAIPPTTLPNVSGYGIVTDIESIDLNGDGNLDLIVARARDNPEVVNKSVEIF